MLSPELQRIIDKVTSYATTPIIGSKGQTAAQGRALLGVGGILEGLQTNAASVAGAASRTAAAESGATETPASTPTSSQTPAPTGTP